MSLFKVREFWSIDLDQLQSHTISSEGRRDIHLPSARVAADGDFVVSPGKFSSIGDQDVFVCADLSGFICIVQVPILEQERLNIQTDSRAGVAPLASPTHSNSSATASRDQLEVGNRQLLAVSRLGCPIVDLKCGYFNSALKQSIAVLSFDQLIVFQVKRRQIDLISANFGDETTGADSQTISESLLSHVFEEHYRLDLLAGEFAQSILSIDCHADSRLVGKPDKHHHMLNTGKTAAGEQLFDGSDGGKHSSSGGSAKPFSKGKQIIQSLHLPQRDKILVQYTNQFLLTLIDSKKVLSHLQLECNEGANLGADSSASGAAAEAQASGSKALDDEQMSRYVGSCPAAHLHGADNCCSLVVSLSDYTIHCLPVSALVNLAKQSVMQRVARNLMSGGQEVQLVNLATESVGDSQQQQQRRSSLSGSRSSHAAMVQQASHCVGVDLESISSWSWELITRPLQMAGIQRRALDSTTACHQGEVALGQLVVMSRYAIDLFSHSGEQLWSHRFETPLICFSVYTIARDQPATLTRAKLTVDGDGQTAPTEKSPLEKLQFADKLISLVCTDNLTQNSSDLAVMDSDRLVWSALVQCKPSQIMRASLKRMAGFLALVDVKRNLLNLSYLGTNNKDLNLDDEEDTDANSSSHDDDEYISKLEFLDESLAEFTMGQSDGLQEPSSSAAMLNLEKKLQVGVQLEAKSSWPSRRIECCIRLQQSDNSTGVLYNLSAILEFDASLYFEAGPPSNTGRLKSDQGQQISPGVVEFQLGTCWPDRREPISLGGTFSTSSSAGRLIGAAEMERLDGENSHGLHYTRGGGFSALPRTLEVKLVLKFNDNQTNSFLQEESFLLPVSLIGQLVHIDHTSGQGQNLTDVMNNLPPLVQCQSRESKKFVCDSFLCLNETAGVGILAALESIVERDLICRAGGESVVSGGDAKEEDKRLAILESVDLLAQSPECQIRFKNAIGLTRQASEDAAVPVMVSFALRIRVGQSGSSLLDRILSNGADNLPNSGEVFIWIHLVDLSVPESASTIPTEMVELRRKNWFNNREAASNAKVGALNKAVGGNKMLMLSIECNRVVPTLLLHNHLVRRLHLDQLVKTKKFVPGEALVARSPAELINKLLSEDLNVIKINQDLHGALQSMLIAHKSDLELKYRSIKEELAREYCKFKISTDLSLSLAKRLHNLSDKTQHQYKTLCGLTQQYPNKLGKLLNELEQLKQLDDELLRLPENKLISIESNQTSMGDKAYLHWANFEQIIK